MRPSALSLCSIVLSFAAAGCPQGPPADSGSADVVVDTFGNDIGDGNVLGDTDEVSVGVEVDGDDSDGDGEDGGGEDGDGGDSATGDADGDSSGGDTDTEADSDETAVGDCSTCAAEFRTCDDDNGICGGCLEGYYDDDGTCRPLGSCVPDDPDSITQTCSDLNRQCLSPALGQPASCGPCLQGFLGSSEGDTVCEAPKACGDSGICPDDLLCLQLGIGDAKTCSAPVCAEGEAWNRLTDTCKTCGMCVGEGTTGAAWPVTDQNGNCVCETQPGYFWDPAVAVTQAVACDKDADGWTNEKVAQLLTQVSQDDGADVDDLAVLTNVRCEIASIDGFVLTNEQGQTKTVTLTDLGSDVSSLRLFETSRNDRGDTTDPMPTHGRSFLPQEANSLTKICAPNVDLNDNGISDPQEGQDYDGGSAFQNVLNKVAYFKELHTGKFVAGKWHIIERSRCEAGFPLSYTDDADPYWQSCHRRRSGLYPTNGPELGYDFARFDCDAPSGHCPLGPPVEPVQTGNTPPPHGVCDAIVLAPDTEWRGMTHSSQFACVTVRNEQGVLPPGEVALSAIEPGKDWVASHCLLSEDPNGVDCQIVATEAGAAASVDSLVWAARTFTPYDTVSAYEGGCIDEGVEWPQLCPGFGVDAPELKADGAPDGFGALACSCDDGYFYGDGGCFCVVDPNDVGEIGNSCETAIPLGDIADVGDSATVSGNLHSEDDVDWYTFKGVDLSPNGPSDSFHVNITFESNPGGEFQFDVIEDGTCATEPSCVGDTQYEWRTDFVNGLISGEGNCAPSPGDVDQVICSDDTTTYRIRVYRNPAVTLTCTSYVLSVSNGL